MPEAKSNDEGGRKRLGKKSAMIFFNYDRGPHRRAQIRLIRGGGHQQKLLLGGMGNIPGKF